MFIRTMLLALFSTTFIFGAVKEISPQNFDAETSQGKVLVDFYGPWCGPCKRLSPVLDQVADEMQGDVKIVKINIDKAPDLSQEYRVQGVPTLILMENGKEKGRLVGFRDKNAVKKFIEG